MTTVVGQFFNESVTTNWQKTIVVIAAISAILLVWLGRYELVGVPAGGEGANGVVYRLDRWTGSVAYMQGASGGQVVIK